jgi:cytochrome c biogenesis protein CcdA
LHSNYSNHNLYQLIPAARQEGKILQIVLHMTVSQIQRNPVAPNNYTKTYMEEWINQVLNSDITSASILPAVFILGFLGAFTSCCNFAVIGAIAGYSGTLSGENRKKTLFISSLSFFIGTVISLCIIGALTGLISNVIMASFGKYWKMIAGMLAIFFGLATLNWLPFKLPSISVSKKQKGSGFVSALVFGLVIGGLSTACNACCNPLFPVVLSASFLKGGTLWGILILLFFAIGYSLPLAVTMLGIGFGVEKLSAAAEKISLVIKYIAGFILIAIGFYLILTL